MGGQILKVDGRVIILEVLGNRMNAIQGIEWFVIYHHKLRWLFKNYITTISIWLGKSVINIAIFCNIKHKT